MKDGKFVARKWVNDKDEMLWWVWDKEKIWVPDSIWTHDLPDTGWCSNQLGYEETPGELGHLLGSYATHILLTARISNVEIVVCVINNER